MKTTTTWTYRILKRRTTPTDRHLSSPFDTLPNEILREILVWLVPSSSRRQILASASNVVPVTHVCRRLRTPALDMPQLWTTICNKHVRAKYKAYLRRSGKLPVTVFLILVDGDTEGDVRFLEDVLPYANYWEEFYFRTGSTLSEYVCILKRMAGLYYAVQLPQLRSMTLIFPNNYIYESEASDSYFYDEDEGYDNLRIHFYMTWKTPSLKKLRTRNIIPLCTGGSLE